MINAVASIDGSSSSGVASTASIDNMNFIPLNIIEEGKISEVNTKILNMNNSDVEKLLHKNNIKLEDVLVGTMDENSRFIYQLKEEVKKDG